jgi:hypothetical protein
MFIISAAAAIAQAAQTETKQPSFADEWRVTAFVRRGKHEEASLERAGVMSRFVREGDRLPGGITVLDVKYDDRQVVLGKGKETAIIQQETAMTAPPASQTAATKQASTLPPTTDAGRGMKVDKPTAMQDANGRWMVAFSNGRNLDMQTYVDRHGGVAGAIQHVKDLMDRENDPERLAYRKAQLFALQRMSATGNPAATPVTTDETSDRPPSPSRNKSVVF